MLFQFIVLRGEKYRSFFDIKYLLFFFFLIKRKNVKLFLQIYVVYEDEVVPLQNLLQITGNKPSFADSSTHNVKAGAATSDPSILYNPTLATLVWSLAASHDRPKHFAYFYTYIHNMSSIEIL